MSLPIAISALLAATPCVGISGTRRPAPASLVALHQLAAAIPAAALVVVGDASGVDQRVRRLLPCASVFVAASRQPGQLAARSIAVVRACAGAGGVWCAFPATSAPPTLRPSSRASACFSGSGNGTWASLALSLGLGLAAVVFLADDIAPPSSFGLVAAGVGWWLAQAPAEQLALF